MSVGGTVKMHFLSDVYIRHPPDVQYIYVSDIQYIYHTSNSCKCMAVNGEALQLQVVYNKSCNNPYQVLQVMHTVSERAMKSKVHMIKLSPP